MANGSGGSVQGYMESLRRSRAYPDDPYKHAYSLLDTDDEDIRLQFQKIVEKHVLLANISDDRMLRLYQNDVIILCQMLDMARREPQFANFFMKTYYGWRGELALTRAKEGMERKLQATPGGYQPKRDISGYGADLPQFQEQMQEEKNIFKKILGGNKLKQQARG